MKFNILKRMALSLLSLSLAVTCIEGAASFYYRGTSSGLTYAASQPKYTYQGIDVSHWQKDIDWASVAKNKKVDFVILRCGYGSDTESHDDAKWQANVTACEEYGIPYGVYLYSYATSSSMIDSEVAHIKRLLKGHTPSLPIYLDMEDKSVTSSCTASQISSMAKRYCKKMDAAGFKSGVYASTYYWYKYLDKYAKSDKHYHWVAQYSDYCAYADEELVAQYGADWAVYRDYHSYEMWQYASTGSVSGISGNVDMNYWYGSMGLISDTTVSNTQDGSKIVWSSTPQANSYYIYRRTGDDSSYKKIDVVDADTLSYVDDSADGGKLYTYKVKMHTLSGFSEAGPKAELLRLENPELSSVSNNEKGIKVKWTKTAGSDGYYIYRKSSADDKWEKIDTVAGKTKVTYNDTGVKAGKKYYYTIRAYSEDGYTSARDSEGNFYYRLKQPVLDEISSKSYGMYISWDEVSKAGGYYIYRKSTADGSYELIDTVEGGDNTTYKDKSVESKNGKNYYYTVRAYITKSSKNYKSSCDSEGLYYYRMTAPELKKAVKKSEYNRFTWEENEKAGGYIVYRKTSKSGSWKKVATIEDGETASYKDTDVKKGKTYYYTVRAYKVKSGTKYYSPYDSDGVKVKR